MARILVVVALAFCVLFGLSTAIIDEKWFENAKPELCVSNVLEEYVNMANNCQKLHENEFFVIPNIDIEIPGIPEIPEITNLIPAVPLGVEGWKCLVDELQKNPCVQRFLLTCASQIVVDDIDFWDKSDRIATCSVYNMLLLCKENN